MVVAAVPPGFSLATAEAVLFIGKATRVLRQPPGGPATNPGHTPYQAHASRAGPAPRPSDADGAGAAHGRAGRERAAGAGLWREAGSAGDEWEGMRQRWAAELRRLAAAPAFSALDFERTVEGIRTKARQLPSSFLWKSFLWNFITIWALILLRLSPLNHVGLNVLGSAPLQPDPARAGASICQVAEGTRWIVFFWPASSLLACLYKYVFN